MIKQINTLYILTTFSNIYFCILLLQLFSRRISPSLAPPSPLLLRASACDSHIMCIMIVDTYMQSGSLRHVGMGAGEGGESSLKNFSCFHYVKLYNLAFPPKIKVCVIGNHKKNHNQLWEVRSNRFTKKYLGIPKIKL